MISPLSPHLIHPRRRPCPPRAPWVKHKSCGIESARASGTCADRSEARHGVGRCALNRRVRTRSGVRGLHAGRLARHGSAPDDVHEEQDGEQRRCSPVHVEIWVGRVAPHIVPQGKVTGAHGEARFTQATPLEPQLLCGNGPVVWVGVARGYMVHDHLA
eukprot:scaffold24196_cov72-Phaeocystis_antarctica.AAC.1